MSDWLSNKFRWLSLIATWAVVCIHSRTDRWAGDVEDYASRIEANIADLFHFAVPLFFVISGYMFVRSYEKYGWGGVLCRKFKSLYVPMVIWSILGLIVCLPIRIYTHHDVPTMIDLCKLPLMLFRLESVHFWYVRALIFLFIAAPLMACVARNSWLAFLLIIAALLIPVDSWAALVHVPVSVMFFVLGALLVRVNTVVLCGEGSMRWLGFWLSLVGLVLAFFFKREITNHYFSVLFEPLFMIGVLWFGYDIVDMKFRIGKFPEGLNVLFFVYCMHLIVICWCGGVMRIVFGVSPVSRLCGYFVLWLTFWIDIAVANVVQRQFPRVFALLSGGR